MVQTHEGRTFLLVVASSLTAAWPVSHHSWMTKDSLLPAQLIASNAHCFLGSRERPALREGHLGLVLLESSPTVTRGTAPQPLGTSELPSNGISCVSFKSLSWDTLPLAECPPIPRSGKHPSEPTRGLSLG